MAQQIRFDWTWNIGHLLTILTIMLGGVTIWYQLNLRVAALEQNSVPIARFVELQQRMTTAEATLVRGREDRLKFQEHIAEQQDKMLEVLQKVREDIATLRAQRTR